MQLAIKREGLGAVHDVAPLFLSLHNQHARIDPRVFRFIDLDTATDELRGLLDAKGHELLVVSLGNQTVGYALIRISDEEATPLRHGGRVLELAQLMVAESARGRGLGHKLGDAVKRLAWAEDCDRMQLTVWTENTSARSLYASLGMHEARTSLLLHNPNG